MNKLVAVLMASIFSAVSFAALAADEPKAPTETAKVDTPAKVEKHEHKKHEHKKEAKESKEDKKEDAKETK